MLIKVLARLVNDWRKCNSTFSLSMIHVCLNTAFFFLSSSVLKTACVVVKEVFISDFKKSVKGVVQIDITLMRVRKG